MIPREEFEKDIAEKTIRRWFRENKIPNTIATLESFCLGMKYAFEIAEANKLDNAAILYNALLRVAADRRKNLEGIKLAIN